MKIHYQDGVYKTTAVEFEVEPDDTVIIDDAIRRAFCDADEAGLFDDIKGDDGAVDISAVINDFLEERK